MEDFSVKKKRYNKLNYYYFYNKFINIFFFQFKIKGKDTAMPGDVPGMGGPNTMDSDYGDNISLPGTLSGKNDFDRRKKKRYCIDILTLKVIHKNNKAYVYGHTVNNVYC